MKYITTIVLVTFLLNTPLFAGYSVTTLSQFDSGFVDSGLTADAAGNLYGTLYDGGQYGDGLIFEIPKSSGIASTIATFNGVSATGNGANPVGRLAIDANGNLFGATSTNSNLFEVASGSHSLSLLGPWYGLSFPGNFPVGTLESGPVLDPSGNLYAVANSGNLIELPKGATTPTLLTNVGEIFTNTITDDSTGDIFGANYTGSIYELPNGGTLNTLASFNPTDASTRYSDAGVYRDSAGNLFGTAIDTSGQLYSEVYEVVSGSNTVVTLATFAGIGITTNVTGDASGNLYVRSNTGTVFELSPASVPEPATSSLIAITALNLVLLRRRRNMISTI